MKVLFLLLTTFVSLALSGSCPVGTLQSTTNNVCNSFNSIPETFVQAQFRCTQQGGNLVNVDSQFTTTLLIGKSSDDYLAMIISISGQAANLSWSEFWIGATLSKVYNDAGMVKIWIWEGLDKIVRNDDWGFNEPSNKGGCAAVKTSDGTWFAEDCSTKKNYVCAFPVKIDVCDDQWTYYLVTGFCYKVFYHSDWTNAENNCAVQKAHLVSVHSKQEADFIQDIAQCGFHLADGVLATFIGLHTTTNDNTQWNWTDGTPTDYVPWSTGQPDYPGVEKCCSIYTDHLDDVPAAIRNNVPCDLELRNYVCKKLPSQHGII